jgi:hypothetical protein
MSKRAFCAVAAATFGLIGIAGCGAEDPGVAAADVGTVSRDLALGSSGAEVQAVYAYYQRYGYFPNDELLKSYPAWRPLVATAPARPDLFDDRMQEATRLFQRNMGLPETGIVDGATRESLAQPRCGFPDGIAAHDGSDKWDLLSAGWGKSNLTWKLVNSVAFDSYDVNTAKAAIRGYISSALAQWAGAASAYTFTEVTGSGGADILIDFKALTPITTSASTTYPPGGDVTMNTNLVWTTLGNFQRIDMPSVLVHELGHSIGLAHSGVSTSVMYPTFLVGQQAKRNLTFDDLQGALAKNLEWTMFDDYGDTDIAFNAHPYGSSFWVLGGADLAGGKQVWEYTGNWVAHSEGALHISVNNNSSQNRPWIVRTDRTIGRFNWATDGFDTIPGCGTDIGVGDDDSVWIVGCNYTGATGDQEVLKFNGDVACADASACWTKATGSGGDRISVGPRVPGGPNVPWVVSNWGSIYRGWGPQPTDGFEQLPGSASDIGAGYGSAWSIGIQAVPGGWNIQVWNEQPGGPSDVKQPAIERRQWVTVPGGGTSIGMANGRPIVTNNAGQSFWSY